MISPFKLPLKIIVSMKGSENDGIHIEAADGTWIADLTSPMRRGKGNAIIKAVNAQPAVLDTLRCLVNLMNGVGKNGGTPEMGEFSDAEEQAKSLLRQLGGETEQGKCGNCGLKAIDPATERCNECGCDHSREPELGGSDD